MEPEARDPQIGPRARARAVTPSLWWRIAAGGLGGWARRSWTDTEASAAEAVATRLPSGPHTTEQREAAPEPLCASRSFTDRPFMAILLLLPVVVSSAASCSGLRGRVWSMGFVIRVRFLCLFFYFC